MRELPILFSTDMVLANLANLKNQTRRVNGLAEYNIYPNQYRIIQRDVQSGFQSFKKRTTMGHVDFKTYWDDVKCPYGKPGDILYVRENWRPRDCEFKPPMLNVEYQADNYSLNFHPGLELVEKIEYSMIAECQKKGLNIEGYGRFVYKNFPISWRPSIHLPKELSRIWLQIGEIRVERLNDITEDDAIDEGIGRIFMPDEPIFYQHYGAGNIDGTTDPIESYQSLWNSINGSNSWDANPWVWVVKYKILSTTGRDKIPKDILLQLDGKEAVL